jgi:alginate O-acetyltransferase complex protein AlgI
VSFDVFPFWAFVLLVWMVWFVIRGNAARIGFLILASYGYYASWNPAYLFLLAAFTVVSFWVGKTVRGGVRFPVMIAGVAACAGALAYAKVRISPLPVGVSFYALQAIAYIADSYRGDTGKTGSIFKYALHMSFFPRLPAGPIVRAEEFFPQLEEKPRVGSVEIWEALVLICFGLFKKMAIADNLAAVVDPVFADLHVSSGRIVLATYAFAVQIYCDFSGYTDIALGLARLFGYRLPENFNWPYLAKNPADFWRRWHISLSNWLRDYIYFSLPGHRSKSRVFSYVNFVITMLICGVWHGLGWTFLLWGLYQGILLASYYAIRPHGMRRERKVTAGGLASVLVMQQLSVFGWILFRLNHITDFPVFVTSVFRGPFSAGFGGPERMAIALLALVAVAHVVEVAVPITKTSLALRWNPWVLTALLALFVATMILSVPKQQLFLYFRF